MKRRLLGCFCVLVSGVVFASGATAEQPAEVSMVVTGNIVIAPDGSVRSHAIDHPDKLPPAVNTIIDKTVAAWKFVPVVVDGEPKATQAKVGLRLIAVSAEHGEFTVRVSGASFASSAPSQRLHVKAINVLPRYPLGAQRARAGGTAYVLLKVGQQGQVLDSAVEQVNLTVRGNSRQMTYLRGAFATAALASAKNRTYDVPTSGPQAHDGYWIVRESVKFTLNPLGPSRTIRAEYGQWQPYVPGPREVVSWLDGRQLGEGSPLTIPDGDLTPLGSGPQLLSSLSDS
ncbi:MAG: energy transducer TonB [Rhodanobacter sp.]